MDFSESLALLLIGLKLGKVIDWPWLVVTCPIWSMPVVTIIISLLLALFGIPRESQIQSLDQIKISLSL